MTSPSAVCEGQTAYGLLGHIFTKPPTDAASAPLYRCNAGGHHFDSLDPACEGKAVELFKTGSHYQMVHAVLALLALRYDAQGPALLFVIGAAIFAGTLYGIGFGGPTWLGAITPVGGAGLIAGWLWLAWSLRG